MSRIMRYYNIGLLPCVMSFCLSCSSHQGVKYLEPLFPKESIVQFELLSGDLSLGKTEDIMVYKDFIVVLSYHPDGNMVHCYNKDNGQLRMKSVFYGRGPGEIMGCKTSLFDSEKGAITIYDFVQHKLVGLSLDEIISKEDVQAYEEEINIPQDNAWGLLRLHNGNYILANTFNSFQEDAQRFIVFDRDGNPQSDYSVWPEVDKLAALSIYAAPEIAISGDGSQWVIGSSYGAILEQFSYEKQEIKREWIKYYYPTDMEKHLNDGCNSQSVLGFGDLFFAANAIYAVVDFDHKMSDLCDPEYNDLHHTQVAVFSDKGTPIRRIQTDCEIKRIFVQENALYAVVKTKEGNTCLGKIIL